MKKLLIFILSVVCVVAGIVLLKRPPGERVQVNVAPLENVINEDLARARQEEGDPRERAKSLRRLALQSPQEAMHFARELSESSTPEIRAAAFEIGGGFEGDEWDALVINGLEDKDQNVRVATLKGVRRQSSPKKVAGVEKFLKNGKRSIAEQLWGQLATLPPEDLKVDRAKAEKQVFSSLSKADSANRSEALIELYKMMPAKSELLLFAEKSLREAVETPELYPSFLYLENFSPERLGSILSSAKWPDSKYFLEESLRFAEAKCPKDFQEIFKKAAAHPRAGGLAKDPARSTGCKS